MNLPQLKKQQLILISGVVLSLAALFMIKMYVDQQRAIAIQQAKERLKKIQADQTPVLVAKKDIDRGLTIGPDDFEVVILPNDKVQVGAVTSFDRISGMTTIAPIMKNEQISSTKLTFQRAGDLAGITPVGKRAITISVDNISALSGMIKGGDHVDVIGMIPIPVQTAEGKQITQAAVVPLFQNVLVLAVGQSLGMTQAEEARYRRKEERQEGANLITLALNPQEANLIAFVQEQGKIRLILRSPTDAKIEPIQPASWDTLFSLIMPRPVETRPKEEGPYVEIYRGLSKERVPLSK